jgi:predicted peptidase
VQGQSLFKLLGDDSFSSKRKQVIIAPIAPSRGWQPHFPSILSLLNDARAELGVSNNPVHLAGQSMGGNGAWSLLSQNPKLFKTITPICGYIEGYRDGVLPSDYSVDDIKDNRIWVFHAEDDSVINVAASDNIVKHLQSSSCTEIKYTRYEPGIAPPCITKVKDLIGHASYELAFRDESWWSWIERE